MERPPLRGPSQSDLVALANKWEPEASASPPGFRRATCVVCAAPMTRMWHLWLHEGGFKKELHMCADCGIEHGLDQTLIVVAAFDDTNDFVKENLPTWKGGADLLIVNTNQGGHPTKAFIEAYRNNQDFTSYLFIQDSMRGLVEDVVEPFRHKTPVVAWAEFQFSFDSDEQNSWVTNQYRGDPPELGIFGPTFYATRSAMEKAEPFFPAIPQNRVEAQGTERAWAWCFKMVGVEVSALGGHDRGTQMQGLGPFSKVFASRD